MRGDYEIGVGDKVFLKCRSILIGNILKFPVEVKHIKKFEIYIVGKSYAFWVNLNNTYRDALWITTR